MKAKSLRDVEWVIEIKEFNQWNYFSYYAIAADVSFTETRVSISGGANLTRLHAMKEWKSFAALNRIKKYRWKKSDVVLEPKPA